MMFCKMNVFEKDMKKNHSIQVAFQTKFQSQTQWFEKYKLKIVDSLAKNLLTVREKVDYPLLEEKDLEEKSFCMLPIKILPSNFLNKEVM